MDSRVDRLYFLLPCCVSPVYMCGCAAGHLKGWIVIWVLDREVRISTRLAFLWQRDSEVRVVI